MNNYGKVIDYLCDLIDVLVDEGINVNNVTLMDLAETVGIPDMVMNAYLRGADNTLDWYDHDDD